MELNFDFEKLIEATGKAIHVGKKVIKDVK